MDAIELEAAARAIVDAGRYMTLGTADADGHPWVSPVWYAHEDARTFIWVSDPGTRHSFNIAARPDVSLVVFDSHAELGEGQGVYVRAVADQLRRRRGGAGDRRLLRAVRRAGRPHLVAERRDWAGPPAALPRERDRARPRTAGRAAPPVTANLS